MPQIYLFRPPCNAVIALPRPRIERERGAEGWLVIRGEHGCLCGDRRSALLEFEALERIERTGF